MISLMISRRPGGRWKIINAFLNDFPNDFPPAGEAGGKTINDFLNDFPPAGEAGGKIINDLSPAGRPAERGGSGGALTRGGSGGQRPPAKTYCYNNNNLMIIPNWGVIPPIFINIINTTKS